MHTLLTLACAKYIARTPTVRRASASQQHRNHESQASQPGPRRDFNVPMCTFLLATRRAMNKTRRKRGRTLKRWQPVVIALLPAKGGDKVTQRGEGETTLQLFSSPFLLALFLFLYFFSPLSFPFSFVTCCFSLFSFLFFLPFFFFLVRTVLRESFVETVIFSFLVTV